MTPIIINSVPGMALVDSGANVSFLELNMMRKIGKSFKPERSYLRG